MSNASVQHPVNLAQLQLLHAKEDLQDEETAHCLLHHDIAATGTIGNIADTFIVTKGERPAFNIQQYDKARPAEFTDTWDNYPINFEARHWIREA